MIPGYKWGTESGKYAYTELLFWRFLPVRKFLIPVFSIADICENRYPKSEDSRCRVNFLDIPCVVILNFKSLYLTREGHTRQNNIVYCKWTIVLTPGYFPSPS